MPGKAVHRGILLRNLMCSNSAEFGEEFYGKGSRGDLLIRVCAGSPVVGLLILMSFSGPFRAFLVAHPVKNLPAMQETRVRFLDWEDPLQNG